MTDIPPNYKPHDGSGMPPDVHPDSITIALFRDGDRVKAKARVWASQWRGDQDWWAHEGDPETNIIAYLPDPDFKET